MAHHQTFYSDTEHVMLAVVFKCPFYTHFPWHTNQINQIQIVDQTRQTADFKNDPSGEDIFCYLLLCLKVADVFEHAGTSKMEQRPRTSSGRRLELHCALHHHLPNTPSQKNPPTLPDLAARFLSALPPRQHAPADSDWGVFQMFCLSNEVGAKTANSKPCFCCDSKHLEHESSD